MVWLRCHNCNAYSNCDIGNIVCIADNHIDNNLAKQQVINLNEFMGWRTNWDVEPNFLWSLVSGICRVWITKHLTISNDNFKYHKCEILG